VITIAILTGRKHAAREQERTRNRLRHRNWRINSVQAWFKEQEHVSMFHRAFDPLKAPSTKRLPDFPVYKHRYEWPSFMILNLRSF